MTKNRQKRAKNRQKNVKIAEKKPEKTFIDLATSTLVAVKSAAIEDEERVKYGVVKYLFVGFCQVLVIFL